MPIGTPFHERTFALCESLNRMGWNVTPPAAPPPVPTNAADQQAYYASAAVNDYTEYTVGVAREAARNSRVYEGSLAKFGAGALTLTGNNSFAGGTDLFGGTLVAASAHALGTGDVDVFGGKLATRSASTVAIGGDLKLGSGSILDLGLGPGGHTLLLDVDGRMTFGGMLTISFLDGFLGAGLYDLFDFGSFEGAFSSFAFEGLSSSYVASLVFGANGVDLNVAAVPEPETYAMLLAGLGAMGWAARRKKRALRA